MGNMQWIHQETCKMKKKTSRKIKTQSYDNIPLKICRSSSFYIDASSQIDIELGTIQYPFKKISTAVKEIHNAKIGISQNIYINIRNDTYNHIQIVQDAIILVYHFNLTFQPTPSTFILTQNYTKTYQYDYYVEQGLILPSDVASSANIFELKYSNVNFYNLDIFTEDYLSDVILLSRNNNNTMYFELLVWELVRRVLQNCCFTSSACAHVQPNMFIFENNTVTTGNRSGMADGSGTAYSFAINLGVNVDFPDPSISYKVQFAIAVLLYDKVHQHSII
eukprot:403369278